MLTPTDPPPRERSLVSTSDRMLFITGSLRQVRR